MGQGKVRESIGIAAWNEVLMAKSNIPCHVGFIPDGNRRWAMDHGLPKEAGYARGINPGLMLSEKCRECGIKEASIYGFTQDNTKRPSIEKLAFSEACVAFAFEIPRRGAAQDWLRAERKIRKDESHK
jgi:undecaprenyl diphosphate synthase